MTPPAERTSPATAAVTVFFTQGAAAGVPATVESGSTLVSDVPPADGRPWIPLTELLAPTAVEQAIDMLVELNTMKGGDGRRLASRATHGEVETWWCHQQAVFDRYLLPFARYQPLMRLCERADRVTIHGCPPDLARLLALAIPSARLPLPQAGSRRPSLLPLRRLASKLVYGLSTWLALLQQRIRPAEYLVYSYDATDERGRNRWIDGVHGALRGRGLRFLEIVWSDSGRRALRQLVGRRRCVLYWQSLAPLSAVHSAVGLDDPQTATTDLRERVLRSIATRVMLPGAQASAQSACRLERWLRLLRPRGIFLMDDPVHVWEMVIACRAAGIPTVAIQHGQFSRATAGLMGYGYAGSPALTFDRYCVWSDYFRDLLARHGRLIPLVAVVASGRPRAADPFPGRRSAGSGRVLILGEQVPPDLQREAAAYVAALLAAGMDVRIRPHPAARPLSDGSPWSAGPSAPVAEGRLEEVLATADVVVASFSSAIFDAIRHGVPVVLFTTSLHADPHELARAGMADIAPSPDELVALVQAAMKLPLTELARRRDVVWRGGLERDGGAVAVREMEALLAHRA